MDLTAVTLNLSYVLHEPSTSSAVAAAADRLRQRQRQIGRVVERYAALTEEALLDRVVIHAPNGLPDRDALVAGALSVRVGAWQLAGRVLASGAGAAARGRRVELQYLDDVAEASPRRVPFFRGPAALRPPATTDPGRLPAWFATLVVRPGGDSLLLTLTPLPVGTSRPDDLLEAALPLAEAAIREFVDQWWCPLPLWARPVEEALPEFASAE